MSRLVSSRVERLPSRVPIGTRYVIEGRRQDDGNLRISLRYLEFPDGRRVGLPADLAQRGRRGRERAQRRTAGRK